MLGISLTSGGPCYAVHCVCGAVLPGPHTQYSVCNKQIPRHLTSATLQVVETDEGQSVRTHARRVDGRRVY